MNTVYSKFYRAVTYPESSDINELCANLQTIGAQYCYILHDRDIEAFENGQPVLKKPHYHFIILFQNAKSNKMLCNALHCKIVYADIPLGSSRDALIRYLVHLDEPLNVDIPKTRYRYDEIHCCSDYMNSLVADALNAPTTFDIQDSKTDEETLLDDLILFHDNSLSLRNLLLNHPKYFRYFNSLDAIYYALFHIHLSGDKNKN